MRVYHGTSADVARRAPVEGLQPRRRSLARSNWEIGSSDAYVYLTRCYALHFAANASSKDEPWGIVEVALDELNQTLLFPDEDWLEQATRNQYGKNMAPPGTMQQRTLWYRERLLQYQHTWAHSLDGLGCVGHRGVVPGSAVTRVSLYDPRSNPMVTMAAVDGAVMLANYRFCGDMHRALTEWAMGDAVSPERIHIAWQVLPEKEQEKLAAKLNDTTGIQAIYQRDVQGR